MTFGFDWPSDSREKALIMVIYMYMYIVLSM